MSPSLEVKLLDPSSILITEHNITKDHKRFPELYEDTPTRVREAIETGKVDKIPPIVVLKNPFDSIEKTIAAYEQFTQTYRRVGRPYYEHEEEILREILEKNPLLCYNGNRRLEEFQRAGIPIRAFIITSQEEYNQMPVEERRIPESLKSERSIQSEIDQNYFLSYLGLLDDVVYIEAEKRYWATILADFPRFKRSRNS